MGATLGGVQNCMGPKNKPPSSMGSHYRKGPLSMSAFGSPFVCDPGKLEIDCCKRRGGPGCPTGGPGRGLGLAFPGGGGQRLTARLILSWIKEAHPILRVEPKGPRLVVDDCARTSNALPPATTTANENQKARALPNEKSLLTPLTFGPSAAPLGPATGGMVVELVVLDAYHRQASWSAANDEVLVAGASRTKSITQPIRLATPPVEGVATSGGPPNLNGSGLQVGGPAADGGGGGDGWSIGGILLTAQMRTPGGKSGSIVGETVLRLCVFLDEEATLDPDGDAAPVRVRVEARAKDLSFKNNLDADTEAFEASCGEAFAEAINMHLESCLEEEVVPLYHRNRISAA